MINQKADCIAASSGGNDSIALMQLLYDKSLLKAVVYNDTGWASEKWPERIAAVNKWCAERSIIFYITQSEGMESLVRRKKGWPMPASKMQFCTQALKEEPTLKLLDEIDPDKLLTVCTGRRRQESQNRKDLPEYQINSPKHGGRECWNPLYLHKEEERNELIKKTGFEILSHSSQECHPCVCANKKDLAKISLTDPLIDKIEKIEIEMGFTKNEKPRTMFRPYRVGGGLGIKQAIEWGHGKHGYKPTYTPEKYIFKGVSTEGKNDLAYEDDTKEGREFSRECDGGFCGN
jgi:3'-phosphoadenosine 5'-phosphosulfate sulfotransferase (PAPS reductase)/FAD synthetase